MLTSIFIGVVVLLSCACVYALEKKDARHFNERMEGLKLFLDAQERRQQEYLALAEVTLREQTGHPIALRAPAGPLPVQPPGWLKKKGVENFIGPNAESAKK